MSPKRSRLLPALLAAAPLAAALPATAPAHTVIVVMENHAAPQIIGNSSAPYINSLAQSGAYMSQSYAVTHPSEPNYLALFSGSTQGLASDACPLSYGADNLAKQLTTAGKTFLGYAEDLPSVGYTGCSSGEYVRKHAPWVNFTNIPASMGVPFSSFPADLNQLPTVSFVIPNMINDMHDGTVSQGDTWLKNNIDRYVQWAKANNSLLILTWDEDDFTAANQVPTIFVGPMVAPGTYTEHVNHYDVLRTVEALYGLPFLANAASATTITDIWQGGTNALSAAITQPAGNVTVTSGTSVSFTGAAGGGTAPYTYTWTFGDGQAPATGAAASHVFYGGPDGQGATYTTTLTVKDAANATATATRTITVSPSSGWDLIANGGFESGASPWTGTTGDIGSWSGETAHAGAKYAWLCGNGSTATESLAQQITVPAGVGSATLSFWLHIDSAETTTSTQYDKLQVQVVNGTTTTTLATYSNLNKAAGYAQKTFDLTAYRGKTIKVQFKGTEDSSLQTSFVLDDVSVLVH